MDSLTIGDRPLGPDHPPYLIAEIGANHNGDPQLLGEMIAAAIRSGVDAVKFQSWTVDSLISRAEYERNTAYSDKKKHFGSLREMVEAYAMTPQLEAQALEACAQAGVHFLSSAFSPAEVAHLEEVGVPAHKVASMDIEHPILLDAIAETGKPIFLSTGMATMSEIARAVERLEQRSSGPIVLFHCVSVYPAPYELLNLRNIQMLTDTFALPVGFSDHASGVASSIAAVTLGAVAVEKHFTTDKDLEGWDHAISVDEPELAALVSGTHLAHAARGRYQRHVSDAELEKRRSFRRRIVVRTAQPAGHVLTKADIDFKRPGFGISPWEFEFVLGRRLAVDVLEDHELEWSDLE